MTSVSEGLRKRTGLIDQVASQLRERIVSGTWPVGSRIPTEPELTQQIGVGRNTVREAVQALVHAGLLERRQGSGTYVIATSELATAMTRQFANARQRDVLEVRYALEAQTAVLAAERRTPAEVEHLRGLQQARVKAVATGRLDSMVDTDMEIHRYIAQLSRNPVLAELYETLLEAVVENIRFNFQRLEHGNDSHLALVDAIAAGDPRAAGLEIESYLSAMIVSLPVTSGS